MVVLTPAPPPGAAARAGPRSRVVLPLEAARERDAAPAPAARGAPGQQPLYKVHYERVPLVELRAAAAAALGAPAPALVLEWGRTGALLLDEDSWQAPPPPAPPPSY